MHAAGQTAFLVTIQADDHRLDACVMWGRCTKIQPVIDPPRQTDVVADLLSEGCLPLSNQSIHAMRDSW